MKYIEWDQEKNEKLKDERGISFEEAMDAIVGDGLLTILENPNKERYNNQRLYIVDIFGYAHVVPCVEDKEKIFLKTVYPSRKYTKQYIEKGDI